jgi:hypothetical protein
MSLGLNPNDTPDLFTDKNGDELPVESLTGRDRTAYLHIDLKVNANGGKPVAPMTAVFAPDPTQLSGNVDVILWFHGDKNYWNKKGTDSHGFRGETIQYYLTKLPLCRLREFILQSSKRKCVLVAPTLNDRTGISRDHGLPGGLRWEQADAEAYLQQVVNAVKKHMGASVSGVGNVVIAGHSGGGHLQGQMAQFFSGTFDKANEVWCFDSTYWGSKPFITWVNKGHAHARLWVYSTGGTTGSNAHTLMELTTSPLKYAKVSPPRPKHARTTVGKAEALVVNALHKVGAALGTAAHAAAIATTQIDILIEKDPSTGQPSSTDSFFATYGGMAGGHYEGMQQYLPALVETSRNLT